MSTIQISSAKKRPSAAIACLHRAISRHSPRESVSTASALIESYLLLFLAMRMDV